MCNKNVAVYCGIFECDGRRKIQRFLKSTSWYWSSSTCHERRLTFDEGPARERPYLKFGSAVFEQVFEYGGVGDAVRWLTVPNVRARSSVIVRSEVLNPFAFEKRIHCVILDDAFRKFYFCTHIACLRVYDAIKFWTEQKTPRICLHLTILVSAMSFTPVMSHF